MGIEIVEYAKQRLLHVQQKRHITQVAKAKKRDNSALAALLASNTYSKRFNCDYHGENDSHDTDECRHPNSQKRSKPNINHVGR